MQDLNRALTDISVIRAQLARGSEFRGFGSASLGASALLAFFVAVVQSHWLKNPAGEVLSYVALWFVAAVLSLLVIGVETAWRARRAHGSFAAPMTKAAIEQLLPALVAGVLLTIVVLQAAPQAAWMLPGLWQIVFCLGAFATARVLPRPMSIVGAWYLVCGLVNLECAPAGFAFSPWAMAVPFGVGQLLVALIQRWSYAGEEGRYE